MLAAMRFVRSTSRRPTGVREHGCIPGACAIGRLARAPHVIRRVTTDPSSPMLRNRNLSSATRNGPVGMLGVRLTRILAGALGAFGVALAQLGLPSKTFWPAHSLLLYVALAMFMVTVLHELLNIASFFRQLRDIRKFDHELRAVLSAGIAQIEKKSGVDWQSVGISSYCVRGLVRKDLRLVEDLRLGVAARILMPKYRPGKGVVGLCFTTAEAISRDWGEFFKSSVAAGREAWLERAATERYGLSWGELMRTEHLTWVSATPVFSPDGRSIGVVSVDAPVDLSTDAVAQVLRELGVALGDVGKPPTSWWSFIAHRND